MTSPEGVRRSVLLGLCAWFVLDSLGSIASGNASNAGFNVLVLLTLAGPLWVPGIRRAARALINDSTKSVLACVRFGRAHV